MNLLDCPAVAKPAGARVVRLLTDDEEGEQIMPKGIYDRSAARKPAQPVHEAAAEPSKKKREGKGVRTTRVARVAPEPAKGRFEVALDLRGGAVTINAASGSLTLAPDEVSALFAFLGRR